MAPLSASAQTTVEASSPYLHAWFEFEYAKQATYASVSPRHQQQILAISRLFDSRRLSVNDASARINALLTRHEKVAVVQIESSYWRVLQVIFPSPSRDRRDPLLDPGTFMLMLLYSSSPAATDP